VVKKKNLRISKESIQGLNAKELIDFLARHRYDEENYELVDSEEFEALPEYVRYFIYIYDFELEYEMSGIYTLLGNEPGLYLSRTIESFRTTQNDEIADCLLRIEAILKQYDLTTAMLRDRVNQGELYQIVPAGSIFQNEELIAQIREVDERLQVLLLDKDFWKWVEAYMQREMNE
jgi:hypothetical protein